MLNLPSRYQFTGDSASGGFGSVAFCNDCHLERLVAIKTIKDASEKHRLYDELNALMLLRSKHVVQVFDIIPNNDDSIGIVQEFIPGDDLFESSVPKSSIENYLKTLWQIASGITDIHKAGVIHRDIKPNNIKFDDEDIIKIFDFGLSRDNSSAVTIGYKGTPVFSAPELFNSGAVPFTKAIDTYAFGVTAIALSGAALPDQLKSFPPQPILSDFFSTLPITLPHDLATILTQCLSHNLANRPAMNTVRDKLGSHLLHDKHQALAIFDNKTNVLNASRRAVTLKFGLIGEIKIEYDGFHFFVASVNGEVFINNRAVTAGEEIPGSCVVALGAAHRQSSRKYITFDVSNPEVMI